MRAGLIVVIKVAPQHVTKMPLPEHGDVVKALSADRANQSLRIAILPG